MTLINFLKYICCWEGEIVLDNDVWTEMTRFKYYSSYISEEEETVKANYNIASKYFNWRVICFTPCYNPETNRVWLEVMIKEE